MKRKPSRTQSYISELNTLLNNPRSKDNRSADYWRTVQSLANEAKTPTFVGAITALDFVNLTNRRSRVRSVEDIYLPPKLPFKNRRIPESNTSKTARQTNSRRSMDNNSGSKTATIPIKSVQSNQPVKRRVNERIVISLDPSLTHYELVSRFSSQASVTSDIGPRVIRGVPGTHTGVDLAFMNCDLVLSGLTVIYVGVHKGYGNTAILEFSSAGKPGTRFLVAHLRSLPTIGSNEIETGNTGVGTGPHLHLETLEYDPSRKEIVSYGISSQIKLSSSGHYWKFTRRGKG
jgi:murein DD-endopeptidase MepM/ murein hydrolase activator NlpD